MSKDLARNAGRTAKDEVDRAVVALVPARPSVPWCSLLLLLLLLLTVDVAVTVTVDVAVVVAAAVAAAVAVAVTATDQARRAT
ncbi:MULTISPECIES: hypothetical protein [Streptomyces]|uniref:hypothetical protein n=1 Tax=Streptomyces TaxID=1883 RepID=UPI002021DA90|nr:hypothetical protein [Streptomyces sp. MCA2]MCL7496693.1 hypothetical protein [Streptomyces sp. MCA2]